MPYIGNSHIAGDHTNNFKVLDDISSFTATFDGSATSVVDTTNNTIRVVEHRFIQGQRVTYTNGSGGNIGGLTTGTAYFVIFDSASTIKLATTASNAASSTAINLSAVGTGSSHTLNVAFDGVNTKFKLTHGSGTGARLNNSTQINVAINNVVQRPNLDPNNFTDGFALEDNHKIVFQTAPTSQDIFWGSIIANTLTTFDISDHKIDTFTGDGSTTEFTLSHTPANNESLMVTINGVLQHPSNASTARAYTLIASIIQFTAAPANGDEIQVRHIGFAGATTADVSGFYGRTGNVALTANDHITIGDIPTVRNINASGIITASQFVGNLNPNIGGSNANFTGIVTAGTFKGGDFDGRNLNITGLSTFVGDASFSGNVSIGGTLTYEDVTNIDSVGIVTARGDIHVGENIAHLGDTDTKIQFTNNNIDLRSGGTSRISVGNYGLFVQSGLGLGFLASTGPSPSIKSGGTNNQNLLLTSGSGNPTRLTVKVDGNVGIGTDNPSTKLDVDATNSSVRLRKASASNYCAFQLDRDASGTEGGYLGLAGGNTQYADTAVQHDLVLRSHSNLLFTSGGTTERLRITSGGNIGINSTSPQAQFVLSRSLSVNHGIEMGYSSGGNQHFIQAYNRGTSAFTKLIINNSLTIDYNGMVKMGTGGVPTDILDVHKDSTTAYDATDDNAQKTHSASITIRNDNGSTNTFSQLVFDTAGTNQSIARIVALRTGTSSNALTFVTEHSNTKAERLRITSGGNLKLPDNAKIELGGGQAGSGDLEIFFDGTHSKIDHKPTSGSLFLAGDSLVLSNSGMSQYYLQAAENGAVSLNYSGSTKLATSNTGISITGVPVATQSTGNIGLELHATGSGRGSQIKYHNDHGVQYVGTAGDTTGNLLIWQESNANIFFATNNTQRLRIDNNGRLILGGANAGPYHQDGDEFNIYSTGNTGMSIFSGTSSLGSLFFADGNNDVHEQRRGAIQYNHNDNYLALWTNSGEKLRITSDGVVSWRSGSTPLSGTSLPYSVNIYRDGGTGYGYFDTMTSSSYSTGVRIRTYNNTTYNNVIEHTTSKVTNFQTNGLTRLSILSSGTSEFKGDVTINNPGGVSLFSLIDANNNALHELGTPGNGDFRITVDKNDSGASQEFQLYMRGNDTADLAFHIDHDRNVTIPNGKVGIGTDVLQDALTLYDSDNNVGLYFQSPNTGSGGGDGFRIGRNDTHAFLWNYENQDIALATNGNTRLTVTSGGNVMIGDGTDTSYAPLHVYSENSRGLNAIFGKGFVDSANYHYDDANIQVNGRDVDGNDTGAGIEFNARNTANSNWLHGAITQDRSGNLNFLTGGAGTTVGTQKFRITPGGNVAVTSDNTNNVPSKLWIYDGSNDPYIRMQRGTTSDIDMGGMQFASSNGNGNNVIGTIRGRATGNSATTGVVVITARDSSSGSNVHEPLRALGKSSSGSRLISQGNAVCVFGRHHETSSSDCTSGAPTYNSVYEHSSSSYRTSGNGAFGGSFVVGGNASYWYPVWFSMPTHQAPQELYIAKYVHNYATWDGTLAFRATLMGTGYGAFTVQQRVHLYQSSGKDFIGKISYTSHNNAYLVCWMLGGGRSYQWGTIGAQPITVNVGDDGGSHNLGPGNTAETYITSNLTINQGYEQAMTTGGMHQQSDGF